MNKQTLNGFVSGKYINKINKFVYKETEIKFNNIQTKNYKCQIKQNYANKTDQNLKLTRISLYFPFIKSYIIYYKYQLKVHID